MEDKLFEQELKKIVKESVREHMLAEANGQGMRKALNVLRKTGKIGKIAALLGALGYGGYQWWKYRKNKKKGLDQLSQEMGWHNTPIEKAVIKHSGTPAPKTQKVNIPQQSGVNTPENWDNAMSPKGWNKKYPKEIH